MKQTISCDTCGKRADGTFDFTTDADDHDRCPKCQLKHEIDIVADNIRHKMEWLNGTHLKHVAEWQEKLSELNAKLEAMEGT